MNTPGKTPLLGTPTLTMLVVASMIGAGVYTTSGFTLAALGEARWVLLAWAIGGGIAIAGAIGYGLLAGVLTENGGEYLYLSRLVHPAVGFVAGWVSFLQGFTGAAAFAAIALESYAMPESLRPGGIPEGAIAIGLVLLCAAAHGVHERGGVISQNVIVIVKLALLTAFIAIAASTFSAWPDQTMAVGTATGELTDANSPAATSSISLLDLATQVMWISLSYSGFNAAIYVAGETKRGAVDVARSMLAATVLVTIIYLALNTIFLYASAGSDVAGQPDVAVVAAQSIQSHLQTLGIATGFPLAMLVRVLVCFGLASSVMAMLVTGPRVYAKMADDGVFPAFLRSDRASPTTMVWVQTAAIIVVILIADLRNLLSTLSMTLALSAAATVATLFVVPKARQSVRQSLGRLAGLWKRAAAACYVIATLALAGLTAWNKPVEAVAVVATIVSGGLIYGVLAWIGQRRGPTSNSDSSSGRASVP